MKALAAALGAALLLLAAVAHGKATLVIVNADGPDAGFNDLTPVSPVGGNCGTTLGAQRLIVFQKAAEIWGNALESAAPITIISNFTPLTCTSSGATLGSAGPTNIFASDDPTLPPGVPGSIFPKPHTWYVSALSGAFAGQALVSGTGTNPANFDIMAHFNSTLDDPNASCNGFRWYYGLDDNHGDRLDLLTVVLHEFGHGLGFLSLTDPATGKFAQGEPDIWASYQYDEGSGLHWLDLADATRAASAISGALAWDGVGVKAAVPSTLLPALVVRVTSAPATPSVVKDYQYVVSSLSVPLTSVSQQYVGELAVASTGWACTALGPLAPMNGKIAIADRGGPMPDAGCTFDEKALNAQAAGAIALLVANNTSGFPPANNGVDSNITIPVIHIQQTDGEALKNAVAAGPVSGAIRRDPAVGYSGADLSARAFLYAPNPLQSGSSVSHWDTSAFPNLLMEPIINSDLTHSLDLTPVLLHDTGWPLSDGGTRIDAGICAGAGGGADAGTDAGTDGGGGGGGGGGVTSSGCTTALGSPAPWLALLGLLALARRRRRATGVS